MKIIENPPNQGMETAEFATFIHRHNIRIMKIVLAIFIVLDVVFFLYLGANPGGFLNEQFRWLIPTVLAGAFALGAWIILKGDESTSAKEYVFIILILGSRLFYGSYMGFQTSITAVYVGLMLLLGTLFYFERRIIHSLLFLQMVLHILALLGVLGNETFITLLITDVFAATTVALSLERYRKRLQAHLMNRSVLEKNEELKRAHKEITRSNLRIDAQLKRTREAEALMKGLLENTDAALVLLDMSGDLKYYNDGLRKISGYGFEQIDEKSISQIIEEEDLEKFEKAIIGISANKESAILPCIDFRHLDGSFRKARIKFHYIDIESDGYILVNIMDITDEMKQKNQVEQLSKMKDVVLAINHRLSKDVNLDSFFDYILSRVREVIPHADLGCIMLLDEEGVLTMASSFGYNQEESHNFRLPLNESFLYHVTGGDYSQTVIINDIQSLLNADYVDIMDNKEHYVVQSSISGPIIKEGRLYGLINIDSRDNNVYTENDITIMEYLREQLGLALSHREMFRQYAYLSKHDQLTGFLNRWYLQEIEEEHAPRWRRYGTEVLIAAMDLNDLKQVNDRLGHYEGDTYIRFFSATIQKIFRATDVLIRLGGDEFVCVFFHMTEADLAAKLDEVNRLLAESDLQLRVPDLHLGFGYGIVRFGDMGFSIEELLKIADARMYVHKAAMKKQMSRLVQDAIII